MKPRTGQNTRASFSSAPNVQCPLVHLLESPLTPLSPWDEPSLFLHLLSLRHTLLAFPSFLQAVPSPFPFSCLSALNSQDSQGGTRSKTCLYDPTAMLLLGLSWINSGSLQNGFHEVSRCAYRQFLCKQIPLPPPFLTHGLSFKLPARSNSNKMYSQVSLPVWVCSEKWLGDFTVV